MGAMGNAAIVEMLARGVGIAGTLVVAAGMVVRGVGIAVMVARGVETVGILAGTVGTAVVGGAVVGGAVAGEVDAIAEFVILGFGSFADFREFRSFADFRDSRSFADFRVPEVGGFTGNIAAPRSAPPLVLERQCPPRRDADIPRRPSSRMLALAGWRDRQGAIPDCGEREKGEGEGRREKGREKERERECDGG